MIFQKKRLILIPSYISIFYLKKNKLVIFKYKDKIKFFKLNSKLDFLLLKNKFFIIGNFLNTNNSKSLAIQLSMLYNKIQFCVVEITHKLYKKLNLVGVGYKVFKTKTNINNEILMFKLGFSHFIFFKVKKNKVDLFCLKNIKISLTGDFLRITQISALIKSFKKPELYKGKGIRFQTEQIVLKQVKKK